MTTPQKNSNCTIQEHLLALYGPTGMAITQAKLDDINAACKTCLKPTATAYHAQKTMILHPDHDNTAPTDNSELIQHPQLIA